MNNRQNCVPSFPMADNMANIDKLRYMWKAIWPEFSWQTVPGFEASRCFQMFAPDISRVGYGVPDANGFCRIYSVICPQQGTWLPMIEGTLNIEVTVTQSGGVVKVDPRGGFIDGQISIAPKIWFSPDTVQNNPLIRGLWLLFDSLNIPFPSSKARAIRLNGYGVDRRDRPYTPPCDLLDINSGVDQTFAAPPFAQHPEAWTVANLAVEIGEVMSTGNDLADQFNELVMEVFNLASGNLLQAGNVLSWNVYATAPEPVNIQEWRDHAVYWRHSIDVNHRSPDGNGTNPRYYDGQPFLPEVAAIEVALQKLWHWLHSLGLFLPADLEQELMNTLSRC